MRTMVLTAMLAAVPTLAWAEGVDGVWKTGADDDGAYLEVTIAPCDTDASKTCGTITKAFTADGEDPRYANLGKLIIWDMVSDGDGEYSDGTVWAVDDDKKYDSKMTLKDENTLDVEGCVTIFCRGQDWTRVD